MMTDKPLSGVRLVEGEMIGFKGKHMTDGAY